jgi:hypothetical protein
MEVICKDILKTNERIDEIARDAQDTKQAERENMKGVVCSMP